MKLKKLSAFLLALLICVQVLGLTVWATGEPDFAPALGEPPVMEQSSGSGHMTHSENNTNAAIITMDRTRTLDSIVAKAKELPHIAFNGTIATPYATTPSIVSPHTPGSLLASDMADALRAFKMVRYVTGLPYENLTFASEYNNYSQHGAVLMAASHQFTHYPTKPDDMSQAFFDIAKRGCGEANIYAGVKNISTAITGFIYDSGASNISRAGHRRWMLRPGGANYGIGLARDATGYTYISLHVFGGPGMYEHESDSYVAWPNGGDFPIQYFLNSTNLQNLPNCPWSINLGAPYQTPVKADITLKLTRTRDNKVWTMNNSTPDLGELGTTDSASMHLAVDNGGYGMQKCITFRPDVTTMGPILDGDVYKVELSGIKKTDGSAATLSYNIRFFDLANEMVRSRVSITVKSGGAALSGATVVIGGQTLTTDANGLVSLRVNNSASYPYTVSKNGYTTSTGNIAVGTSDVQQTVNLTGGSSPVNIAAASVSGFVPPAANAAPQVNTNLTPGHTSYTVAGLTWSPSVAAFGYATVYTATVTLRAASGYTFNSALTPTVNTGTPGAGTVSGIGSGNTLTFNVVFPATAALSDDYGNDFGTAYNWALTGGATNLRDGNFEVKGDVDMFRFNVPVTGSYEFFTSNNGTVDTVGTLYNSAMSQIGYDDDSAGSRNFKITATLTQGQMYYLKVSSYGNNYTGAYQINIVAPAAIADDYGNTIDTAYNWAITGPNPAINGNIERLGDIDVFKFTAPFSGTYQIISTSSIDMVGTLYNSARSVLASDDDAAGNRQFKISYPLVKGQVYYVQVGTYANYYTGAYSIRLMTPPQ